MSRRIKKSMIIFLAAFIILGMVMTSVLGFIDLWHAPPATDTEQGEEIIAYLEDRARELENLIAQNGDNHYYRELGDLYYQVGYRYFFEMNDEARAKEYWKAAIEPYEKALEEDPTDTNACINLGLAAFNTGDFDMAGEYFGRAVDNDPESALAHLNYGIYALVVEEDRDVALKHLERAFDLTEEGDPLRREIEYWLDEARRSTE